MPQDDYMSQSESQHDEMNSHSRGNTLSSHMNCYPMDTRHSQTVGERGPVVLQDNVLHEKLETFAHSKILERPVHVKGYGAFGYFQTINSMRKYTKLCFLQTPGQQVPVTVRFSFAVGNQGTPDTSRNVRGFSTKFYTEEGIFDLLCNHLPVFFVRDAMRFPEGIAAFSPSPVNNLTYPERLWSFIASAPEATHFITRLFSDAGTLKSFRHMPGFSVNTYVWINAEGVRRYVKYYWLPLAGEQYIDRQEATMLTAKDPNIAGQDLYDTIASGKSVQYELRVQLMDPSDECRLPFDPLDDTKVWDEQQYPFIPVGRLVLNHNPWNFMEQVEKLAFSPSNLLEGVELSDDKILQGRANIYGDAQRRRFGPDFRKIPINHQMNWTPNSMVTSGNGRYVEGNLMRSGLSDPDDFTQAGQYYRSLSTLQQNHLVDNLASDLAPVSFKIQRIVLEHLHNASAELGERVTKQILVYAKR
ncbi:catalase [Clostridium botulinum]|uniref:catalase n=2 Tax=Clostridium botulinum TaxID=1491 RepID=B1IL17_CLOBK|nr:catalase [Clostridium botulinum]ACA44015.1 catalase [Clostridium botulinum B1 str. Okra]MBD5562951.1 catalase [Clostridium botulinum]MBD5567291.1 catalase [Clostridium botulinum]MBD5570096.1 catalase [Clostridium botulinum]MBD5574191.1 catalase [Clostridium botulinum]